MSLRTVFLGCGAITARHAGTLRKVRRDVELSFASRDRAKAEAYRDRFGGAAYGSYDEALAGPAEVAFVALPPALHAEWVDKALAAGKHVIVEKPPFPSVAALDAAAARAAAAGRRILVAENYYYKPILRRVRELVSDGVVGDVLFVLVNALKTQKVSAWREGEGALLEGGIHWVCFMNNLGLTTRRARGVRMGAVDRSTLALFEYEGGAAGTLAYSWEVPSPLGGIRISRIHGRQGTITFESNGAFVMTQGKSWSFGVAPGLSDAGGFKRMFRDFYAALEEGREPEMSLARARRDLETIEEISRVD